MTKIKTFKWWHCNMHRISIQVKLTKYSWNTLQQNAIKQQARTRQESSWRRQTGGKVWKGFATKSLNCFAENGPTESDWLLWYLFGSGTAQRVIRVRLRPEINFLIIFEFNYFLNFVLGFCLTYLNIIRSMFGGSFWLLIISQSLYSFWWIPEFLQIHRLWICLFLIRD